MTRVGRWALAPSRVPRIITWMFAAAALVACVGLVVAVLFAQSQADASDAKAECRARISNYVGALQGDLAVATASGLLRAIPPKDLPQDLARLPLTFPEAVAQTATSSSRLIELRQVREDAVEICTKNPDFDPATYDPKEGAP